MDDRSSVVNVDMEGLIPRRNWGDIPMKTTFFEAEIAQAQGPGQAQTNVTPHLKVTVTY